MAWKQQWRRPLLVGVGVGEWADRSAGKQCQGEVEFPRRYKVWEQGRPWRVDPVVKGADFGSLKFTGHQHAGDRNHVTHLVPEPRAEW